MKNLSKAGVTALSSAEARSTSGGFGLSIGIKVAIDALEKAYKQFKHGVDDGFNQTK